MNAADNFLLQFLEKIKLGITVRPVLNSHSERTFKTDYCLMHVKSLAECGAFYAFCNTFDL